MGLCAYILLPIQVQQRSRVAYQTGNHASENKTVFIGIIIPHLAH